MSLERKAQASLFRGEDKAITIRLVNEDDGTPYNLSNASDISVFFKTSLGNALIKTKASGDVTLVNNNNAMEVRVRAAESVTLALGDNLPIEVHVVDNTYLTIAQIDNALTVKASLFPNDI